MVPDWYVLMAAMATNIVYKHLLFGVMPQVVMLQQARIVLNLIR
jgi:hypothetical protein